MAEWIEKQSEPAGKLPGKYFMKRAFIVLFLLLCFLYHEGWAEGPRPQPSLTDARLFAGGVPLGLEWEGMSAGPLREAEYAEEWLKRYPRSPLVPFLHLFAAHRYRSAFEAAGLEKAGDLLPMAGRKHREHLRAARSAGNDKINCIADDMDTLPYVYLSGFGRP